MTLLIWLAVSSLAWGAVLWLAGRLLQRSNDVSGRARQWIWRGATALLVAPWVATPFVILFGLGLAPAETLAMATVSPAVAGGDLAAMHVLDLANVETSVVENGGSVLVWLATASPLELTLLVMIAGWLVRFVLAQHALKSLLGIVNMSRPAEPGVAKNFVLSWSRRLKLRGAPRLLVTQEQHSPFSFGVVRPTICLPQGLEDRLSKESLDLVVGHECLHVARGDGWLRPLERVTADVLWFNPFAWLIRRELDIARELAVDEAVVEMAASRIVYARALRDVAGFSAGLSTAAPAASMSLAGGRSLMLRVTRTLSQAGRKPARAAMIAASVLGLVGAPIAVAQVMLAIPAPPEAPKVPKAPATIEAYEILEAPEAPAALEAPQDPEAPQAPEAPPAAPQRIYVSSDGIVRASFAAKVTAAGVDKTGGHSVSLAGIGRTGAGDVCMAYLDGLGGLSVVRGDTVARGQAIGERGHGPSLSFTVQCTDEVDGAGKPVFPSTQPAPPAPPAAPAPIKSVAPAAPVAPAPLVGVTPAVAPAPPAPAAPPKPIKLEGGQTAVIVAPARISGPFGERVDPINKQIVFHDGVDIAASAGTVVFTPVEGSVVYAGVLGGGGNTVQLQSQDGVTLTFAQMEEINVKVGDRLKPGVAVGSVGSSGRSTGAHLHFEVSQDGQKHDPEKVTGLVLIGEN
jgi:murein DD-endopeptidase MepM/ murein hydrolase activator NlpD/Zn-dependent protease with chaperone function